MTKEEAEKYDLEMARVTTANCAAFHTHIESALDLQDLKSPVVIPPDGLEQTKLFVNVVFKAGESIRVAKRKNDMTLREVSKTGWISELREVQDEGLFVAINPVTDPTKRGRRNGFTDDAMAHRHILLEMDDACRQEQLQFWQAAISIGVPVLSLTDSGGKSYHALIRIDAKDKESYKAAADVIADSFIPFHPDPRVKNNSRLSRLPGVPRRAKGGFQRLIYVNPKAELWNQEASYVRTLREFISLALPLPVKPVSSSSKIRIAGAGGNADEQKSYTADLRRIINGRELDMDKLVEDLGLETLPRIPEGQDSELKWFIRCPWQLEHSGSGGNDNDYDSYLYQRKTGAKNPWGFHCSHAHCHDRDFRDFLSQCKEEYPEAFSECVTPYDDLDLLFGGIEPPVEPPTTEISPETLTEAPSIPGDAEIFRKLHEGRAKYLRDIGVWYTWNGVKWCGPSEGGLRQMVKQVWRLRAASADADAMPAILKSAHPQNLEAILDYAKTEEWARSHSGEFNRNPHTLGCPNGTLDLRTGEIRPARPEDMISMQVRFNYVPDAVDERFERFEGEIHPDNPDVTRFLETWMGYCLNGSVREHKMVILHGPKGRNGKSTLVETMLRIVGDYGISIPSSALAATKAINANAASPVTASLKDKRFIITTEVNEGMLLDESLVKSLCSGDTISARPVYGKPIEFPMCGKITMSTNHRPQVRGTDNAIWSRLVLVEFKESFLGKEDMDLEEDLKRESEGIFARMVRGSVDWHQKGLRIPAEVVKYTEGHRNEQDQMEQFISEVCETPDDHHQRVSRKELYEIYGSWASKSRQKLYSRQDFTQKMEQKNFQSVQVKGERFWTRIRLRTVDLPEFSD